MMKSLCALCLAITITTLASGLKAEGADKGSASKAEQRQPPGREQKSQPREFQRVFCAERSVAQRFMRVDATDCNEVCDDVYREYPCDLQQRFEEGWKIMSVSTGSIVVNRDPCECRVSGTESVLERD